MQKQMNSSYAVAALTLGVPQEALYQLVTGWTLQQQGKSLQDQMDDVGEQMAREMANINPLLAQRWNFLKTVKQRDQSRDASRAMPAL
jgi:hypothetical protein